MSNTGPDPRDDAALLVVDTCDIKYTPGSTEPEKERQEAAQ
jgi:hypothetical protein